jgi:hypothetical protein
VGERITNHAQEKLSDVTTVELPHVGSSVANGGQSVNSKEFLMRQLQLMAFGEPSDVIQLKTLAEPALGPEDVLVSMEAAPLNPSRALGRTRSSSRFEILSPWPTTPIPCNLR